MKDNRAYMPDTQATSGAALADVKVISLMDRMIQRMAAGPCVVKNKVCGEDGTWTATEMAEALNKTTRSISPRFVPLYEKALVVPGADRVCAFSGKEVKTWKLAPEGTQPPAVIKRPPKKDVEAMYGKALALRDEIKDVRRGDYLAGVVRALGWVLGEYGKSPVEEADK